MSNLKIIFLDIDGVIATPLHAEAYGNEIMSIDPTLARAVARICEKTKAKIVVSSTWRHHFCSLSTMTILFQNYGLAKHMYTKSWRTSTKRAQCRGDQIGALAYGQ